MCEKSWYTLIFGSNSEVENDIPGVLVSIEILFVNKSLFFSKFACTKIKKIKIENNDNIVNKKFLLKVVI